MCNAGSEECFNIREGQLLMNLCLQVFVRGEEQATLYSVI